MMINWVVVGFDDGSPDGYDPLQLVREMAARGITLVCVYANDLKG